MIRFFRQCMGGLSSSVSVTTAPLYRYPYRNSMEAMVGDWRRIGKDVDATIQQLTKDVQQDNEHEN